MITKTAPGVLFTTNSTTYLVICKGKRAGKWGCLVHIWTEPHAVYIEDISLGDTIDTALFNHIKIIATDFHDEITQNEKTI